MYGWTGTTLWIDLSTSTVTRHALNITWAKNSWAGREDLARYQALIDAYYALRGCSPVTGIPERTQLERLGLCDMADVLHGPN